MDPGVISKWTVANTKEDPCALQAIDKPQERTLDKAGQCRAS